MPTALVTGASSGIGLELARLHAERGGDLVVIARRAERLAELRDELEGAHSVRVHTIAKDLTLASAPQEVFDEIARDGIEIDYLINNAGFGGQGRFHEREWEDDRSMIQLNVVALTQLCRLFLPGMVARGGGRILNVSSTASLPPGGPLQAVYFATKAFVTSFGNGIAEELRGTGVTVTSLLPGATATEFAETAGLKKSNLFKKAFSAREVAEDGYQGMLEGTLEVITGVSLKQRVLFSIMPFVPNGFVLKQVRELQEVSGEG